MYVASTAFHFRLTLCGDNPVCGSASIYTVLVEFISVYLIVGVVSRVLGFMPSLFSVRRTAISFSDHTRVF